jgi:7-keto-8-aminopelargonate synthetase-like enzyme
MISTPTASTWLLSNIRRVKTRLLELGFDVGRSESAIVPVIVRSTGT